MAKAQRHSYAGVFPIAPTPFAEAGDLDLEAVGVELLHDEIVVDAQRQAEGVEAGTEVRARGGNADRDPATGA